jgi:hypothetical protein
MPFLRSPQPTSDYNFETPNLKARVSQLNFAAGGETPPAVATTLTSAFCVDGDADIYHRRWSRVVMGATSGFLFSIACFVFYCCYLLMSPYMSGISLGILLSIVLHPKTKHEKATRFARCVAEMQRTNTAWGLQPVETPSKATGGGAESVPLLPLWLRKWFGALRSLLPFVRYAVHEGALFLGMQKLPTPAGRKKKSSSVKKKQQQSPFGTTASSSSSMSAAPPLSPPQRPVRGIAQCCGVFVFIATATMLTGIVPFALIHAGLLVMCIIVVPILSEQTFVLCMEKLWKLCLVSYFCCALAYCFFTDVVAVTNTVQRTTSVVVTSSRTLMEERVGGVNWTELTQLKNRLVSEFVTANNLTDVVEHMKTLEPLVANLSWTSWSASRNWSDVALHLQQAYQSLQSSDHDDVTSLISSTFSSLGDKSRLVGITIISLLLKIVENVVNIFDGIYETALFVFVFRYLTELQHTVVYYLIAKMLSPLHHPLAKEHAVAIEQDITISFQTLLQSFWHMTWFHFCATYCCFRFWESPLPFFSGLLAIAMALFPFVPKWFSPCLVKFFVVLGDRILGLDAWPSALFLYRDFELLTFAGVSLLVMKDDWLLSVERGLRGAAREDARGVVREQLPTFVVGTCIILGLVVYGLRGVLLGPLTVIVARTIFDNWDSLSSGLLPPQHTTVTGAAASSRNASRNGSFSLPPSAGLSVMNHRGGLRQEQEQLCCESPGARRRPSKPEAPLIAATYDVTETTDMLLLKKKQ